MDTIRMADSLKRLEPDVETILKEFDAVLRKHGAPGLHVSSFQLRDQPPTLKLGPQSMNCRFTCWTQGDAVVCGIRCDF